MAVLDTTFLIDPMRGRPEAEPVLDQLLEDGEPLGVSAITIMELFHGVSRSRHPDLEERRVLRALRGIPVHSIDFDMARFTGTLDGRLSRDGVRIAVGDLLVASAGLRVDQPIVTRSRQAFAKVPGVEIIGY